MQMSSRLSVLGKFDSDNVTAKHLHQSIGVFNVSDKGVGVGRFECLVEDHQGLRSIQHDVPTLIVPGTLASLGSDTARSTYFSLLLRSAISSVSGINEEKARAPVSANLIL